MAHPPGRSLTILLTVILSAALCFLGGVFVYQKSSAPARAEETKATSTNPSRPPPEAPPEPATKLLQGSLNVTLLVASDTHIGYGLSDNPDKQRDPVLTPEGIEHDNLRMIRDMNSAHTRFFPFATKEQIEKPSGVLISGDLTENGGESEFSLWKKFYGLDGTDGVLEYPVYEGAGNHDRVLNWHVRDEIKKRHGGRHYFVDFGDLRVVCLGEAPDDAALEVLKKAFETAASDIPFVLFFHMPLQGPYSEDNWFGRSDGRETFRKAIAGRRILGIFHGHYHATGAYRWQGYDVYNVGSPKHSHQSYSIVHINDDTMSVAEWNYSRLRYSWWHQKPIREGSPSKEVIGADRTLEPPAVLSLELR